MKLSNGRIKNLYVYESVHCGSPKYPICTKTTSIEVPTSGMSSGCSVRSEVSVILIIFFFKKKKKSGKQRSGKNGADPFKEGKKKKKKKRKNRNEKKTVQDPGFTL